MVAVVSCLLAWHAIGPTSLLYLQIRGMLGLAPAYIKVGVLPASSGNSNAHCIPCTHLGGQQYEMPMLRTTRTPAVANTLDSVNRLGGDCACCVWVLLHRGMAAAIMAAPMPMCVCVLACWACSWLVVLQSSPCWH